MKLKSKGILLASAILGSVAIVSTGFAAWVITSPSTSSTANGNIQVETVTDERVNLVTTFKQDDNGKVSYGAPASQTDYTNKWLENSEGVAEDLDGTFKVTATQTGGAKAEGTISVSIKLQKNTTPTAEATWVDVENFETLNKDTKTTADVVSAEQTLITLPTFTNSYTLVNGEVEIDAMFGWGTAFGSINAYDYYNRMEIEEANFDKVANSALYNLGKLETLLKNTRFVITVTYTAA